MKLIFEQRDNTILVTGKCGDIYQQVATIKLLGKNKTPLMEVPDFLPLETIESIMKYVAY